MAAHVPLGQRYYCEIRMKQAFLSSPVNLLSFCVLSMHPLTYLWSFNSRVGGTRRHLITFGEKLEVMNECFHWVLMLHEKQSHVRKFFLIRFEKKIHNFKGNFSSLAADIGFPSHRQVFSLQHLSFISSSFIISTTLDLNISSAGPL